MTFKDDENGIVFSQIIFIITLIGCVTVFTVFAPVIDGIYDASDTVTLSAEATTAFGGIYDRYGFSLLIVLISSFIGVIVRAIIKQQDGGTF